VQFSNKNSMRNIHQVVVLSSGFCHQTHSLSSLSLANTEKDKESYETCYGVDLEAVKDVSKVTILSMYVSSFCLLSTQGVFSSQKNLALDTVALSFVFVD
jgi:hypothetical protein